MRRGGGKEILIFLFVLAVLFLNAPILSIFSLPDYVLGIPILYLYLFAVWAVLIALMAVSTGSALTDEEGEEPTGETTAEEGSE